MLSKEYVEQMKKQQDLKFALTLKFMNSSKELEETIQSSLNEIKNLSDEKRNKIMLTVENAINFADVLAREIYPITAPMEIILSDRNNLTKKEKDNEL